VRQLARLVMTLVLAAALAAPAAHAAGKAKTKSATTATPAITVPSTAPQPSPTSPFAPLQGGVDTGSAQTQPTTTPINTKRPGDTGLGRGTLYLLVGVAFALIIAVAFLIWYEGRRHRTATKRRRQRMRSGRTPQVTALAADGRRGPPPPPRKRRAAAAKRKKR
jgi:hypothetical protein